MLYILILILQFEPSSLLDASSAQTPTRNLKVKSKSLKTISAGLFTPPNTIDFKAVFSNFGERLLDSPVVLAVMLSFIIIYIPLLLWMIRKDKQDQLKVHGHFN